MSAADLLAQGISAARAGRKDEAQATLLKVLEADDRSELAWLWLSGILESPAERQVCLENVLEINPANSHARRGLAILAQTSPTPPRPASAPAATAALAAATLRLPTADAPAPAATLRLPTADAPATSPRPPTAAAPAPVASPRPPTADVPAPAATLWLPPAAAALPIAAAPATTDTIELPQAATAPPAPARQPWWRPRTQASEAKPSAAPASDPAAPLTPAPAPAAPTLAAVSALAAQGEVAPPEATIALPQIAADAGNVEEPCPYCGATTLVSHRRCPSCQKSLMMSGVRREDRSLALKILVGLYALGTLGTLSTGMLQIAGLAAMGASGPEGGGSIVPAIIGAVLVLFVTSLYAGFTLALWRRKAWAFILHWVGLVFNLLGLIIGAVVLVIMGGAAASMLGEMPSENQAAVAGMAGAATGFLGLILLCSTGLTLAWLALTVACHGDFFGRKVRLSTAGTATMGDPYNSGIAYRNRGMWYMAAHEWELAARSSPRDVTVRRALGLAYGQLGRYAQARDELTVALAIAPGNPQLTEDLALVERLAAKKR